jgi:site-specific recombinase XerD
MQPPKELLDQVRDIIRLKHYSYRTEQSYVYWIRRFILFHHKRRPKEMSMAEIEAFLIHLAVEGHVAASTQNQALSALLFLYRHGLHQELDAVVDAVRAKPSRYLPTVLTPQDAPTEPEFGNMCFRQSDAHSTRVAAFCGGII